MFEAFYGLSENPFRMSADEQFRFMHKAYKKAWAYLNYALDKGEGFVLITGRPGTGKTTLIHDTLSDLDSERIRPVRIISNQFQGEELLRLVALELGLQAQEFDKATLLTRIEQYALTLHQDQSRMVVIVDEAQNLSAHGLEELRLLSNLQIGNQPLFQIVLIGQEELRNLIYGQAMENITQRIVATCTLEPMPTEHVQGYVEHRLGIVGWDGDPEFDPGIFEPLQRVTHGVPRDINLVMARLLLFGSLEEKHQLSRNDLITVLNELGAEQRLTDDQIALIRELSKETYSDGVEQVVEVEPEEDERLAQTLPTEDVEEQKTQGPQDREEEISATELPDQDVRDEDISEHEVSPEGVREGDVSGEEIPDRDHRDTAKIETALNDDQIQDADQIPEDDASTEMDRPLAHEEEVSDTQTVDDEVEQTADTADTESIADQADTATPALATDKEARVDSEQEYTDEPLPEIHALPEAGEHRPQGLLTDVDELLGVREEEQSAKASLWRWFFYPVAIALLVIAILVVRYPDDADRFWQDFQDWGGQYINGLSDRLSSQTPQPAGDSTEQLSQTDRADAPSSAKVLTEGGFKEPVEKSPSMASEAAPQSIPGSASLSDATAQSLQISPQQPYLLILDPASGKFTAESELLLTRLVRTLRDESTLSVSLIGMSASETGPLQAMRDALERAELVSAHLLKQGIKQERIAIEGRSSALSSHPNTVEFRLRR